MTIINLLCAILLGLWLWSLIRSFLHHKILHFIVQLLLGIFILIPLLTFIMKRSSSNKKYQFSSPYRQYRQQRQHAYGQQKQHAYGHRQSPYGFSNY